MGRISASLPLSNTPPTRFVWPPASHPHTPVLGQELKVGDAPWDVFFWSALGPRWGIKAAKSPAGVEGEGRRKWDQRKPER